ncbi:BspA family leucine-rich repeat surface protein [uncultured Brachyspira sp.]|mgnify:FL=1|uniref:BspA family leucine-rich repeat surface protein n=1 Tax=uncultured Brachyspira sp. TaxID=221953 RepID=UPI002637D8D4|nr:BspA family leucine-rich repeat surface protein [uncultured Brachyspira sp.]
MRKEFQPKTREELLKLLKYEDINLGSIDTSFITNMSVLCKYSKRKDFSGIETWDTSNVEKMEYMFYGAQKFNQNINNWNIDKLKYVYDMFGNNLDLDGNNVLEIYLKFYCNKNTKKAFKQLDNLLNKSNDIKKFYQAALRYNKKSAAEIIKKIENNYYDELKDLI